MDGASNEVVGGADKTARYIAAKGFREIARSNDLMNLIAKVIKDEKIGPTGTGDIIVWDTGTVQFPMMSVVASTCKGWISIHLPGQEQIVDSFGMSLTPSEMTVLKQFFEVWKLEGGQTVANAICNIYEQTYVKDFKPGPGQIRLDRDQFKVFVDKLLKVVNHVSG